MPSTSCVFSGHAKPPSTPLPPRMQALEQLDTHLQYFPKFLVHKNKQRLTKITQYLIRMRKLAKKSTPALMTMPARKEKQLARKEARAEKVAQLENAIEKELLERLKSGTYGDIYNFPAKQYEKVWWCPSCSAVPSRIRVPAAGLAMSVLAEH